LVSPVLLVLFLGTIDLSRALLTARRMEMAAAAIAEIGVTGASQAQAMNKLTSVQAWQATTAAFAYFPEWTGKLAKGSFAIALSGVTFTASPPGCTQGCAYSAKVTWSVANELGAPKLRACGPLTTVPDNAATSYTTLPVDNLGPTSLLVADISYTFQPMFLRFVTGDIPMMQSAYISPRIDSNTQLGNAGGAGVSVNCAPVT